LYALTQLLQIRAPQTQFPTRSTTARVLATVRAFLMLLPFIIPTVTLKASVTHDARAHWFVEAHRKGFFVQTKNTYSIVVPKNAYACAAVFALRVE
jgi:hypothetical protein